MTEKGERSGSPFLLRRVRPSAVVGVAYRPASENFGVGLERPAPTIHLPSRQMVSGWNIMSDMARDLRPKAGDSEKITINLGYVDLGHIDLLVEEGFYSNRTDFIRTAIRNQVDKHADVVRQSVTRKSVDLGLRHFNRADLEAVQAEGRMLDIRVLGLAAIAQDVSPELARATIATLTVLGALHAPSAVKAALADRIR